MGRLTGKTSIEEPKPVVEDDSGKIVYKAGLSIDATGLHVQWPIKAFQVKSLELTVDGKFATIALLGTGPGECALVGVEISEEKGKSA